MTWLARSMEPWSDGHDLQVVPWPHSEALACHVELDFHPLGFMLEKYSVYAESHRHSVGRLNLDLPPFPESTSTHPQWSTQLLYPLHLRESYSQILWFCNWISNGESQQGDFACSDFFASQKHWPFIPHACQNNFPGEWQRIRFSGSHCDSCLLTTKTLEPLYSIRRLRACSCIFLTTPTLFLMLI